MFSSSGIFEKDVLQGQTLEAEGKLGESSFDFIQNLDEFDLEQSCLLKLKIQREKIQQLTKLYLENDKELQRRNAKEKMMQEQIDKLTQISSYQGQWEQLNHKHEALSKKSQLTQAELIEIKKEFQAFTVSKVAQLDQLKEDVKYYKEQKLLSDAHWEAIILEKQEQILKQSRKSQQDQYELCDHIKQLEQKIQTLQEQLACKLEEHGTKKVEFKNQIQARQEDLVSYQKAFQSMKKLNTQLKVKIVQMEDNFSKEKEELLSVLEQLRSQIKIYKKDQAEKQNQVYEYKQMIKKCDHKNQSLEQTVQSLKNNMKKTKINTDSNIKKMALFTDEEKGKMDKFIIELKTELQKSQQERNCLLVEVKKLKGLIDRKQQQEKQRKLLLMSQFREIDKMEKMVKKIL